MCLQSAAMPMYRYRCTECGAHEEHLQKISDSPLEDCSSCGGRLAKQLTAAAFHLKGGGWYKDLYASAKPGESGGKAESGGKSDSGAGSSAESTSSKKPDATPSTSTTSSSAA
jgi:putative FmdB family regulatory protein